MNIAIAYTFGLQRVATAATAPGFLSKHTGFLCVHDVTNSQASHAHQR